MAHDPGGTTGIATCEYRHVAGNKTKAVKLNWDRYQLGPEEHHVELWNAMNDFNPDVLIWERFQYQRRELDKGVSLVLDSREYIGLAKLFAAQKDISFHEQTPHQGKIGNKNIWTETKLKGLGLYIPGAPHANDATGHLLYYLVFSLGMRWILEPLRPKSDQ